MASYVVLDAPAASLSFEDAGNGKVSLIFRDDAGQTHRKALSADTLRLMAYHAALFCGVLPPEGQMMPDASKLAPVVPRVRTRILPPVAKN